MEADIYNVYIAVGAFVQGKGALLSRFGYSTLHISEVISVTLRYFGFLEPDRISMQKNRGCPYSTLVITSSSSDHSKMN